MPRIALIIGGAKGWQSDLDAVLTLISTPPTYFIVNDQIATFPGNVVACTLHPEKLDDWLSQRIAAGLTLPLACWTRLLSASSDLFQLQEWGGTSGLFAYQVTREYGYERVIFCGVPMDDRPNAFHGTNGGIAIYSRHRRVWRTHAQEIKLFARSMSGWTAELLGVPTSEWFLGENKNVPTCTYSA